MIKSYFILTGYSAILIPTVGLSTSALNPCGPTLTDSKDGKIQQSAATKSRSAKAQELGLTMTRMDFHIGNSSAAIYKRKKRCYLIAHHPFLQPRERLN